MTRQLTNAYDNVVLMLEEARRRLDIPRRDIERLLTIELGVSKPETFRRNLMIMVDLGYLKYSGAGYDLVAVKIREIKRRKAKQQKLGG